METIDTETKIDLTKALQDAYLESIADPRPPDTFTLREFADANGLDGTDKAWNAVKRLMRLGRVVMVEKINRVNYYRILKPTA